MLLLVQIQWLMLLLISVPSLPETPSEKKSNVEFNPEDIISDPGLRIPIDSYNINIRDQVRRAYIAKGPCRPKEYTFPKKHFGKIQRSFQQNWFIDFDWYISSSYILTTIYHDAVTPNINFTILHPVI